MPPTKKRFTLWKRVRDGTLSRVEFVRRMQAVKFGVNRLLLWGYVRSPTTSFCRELLRHCSHLWTFLEVDGVEPTNNAAERALRHAVIWRKLSFGTQSAAGRSLRRADADGHRDLSPGGPQHLRVADRRRACPLPSRTRPAVAGRGITGGESHRRRSETPIPRAFMPNSEQGG